MENAGVENAALSSRGGKRGSGKRGTKFRGVFSEVRWCEAKESRGGSPPVGSRSKSLVGSLGDGPLAESSNSSMNFYQHGSIAAMHALVLQ